MDFSSQLPRTQNILLRTWPHCQDIDKGDPMDATITTHIENDLYILPTPSQDFQFAFDIPIFLRSGSPLRMVDHELTAIVLIW